LYQIFMDLLYLVDFIFLSCWNDVEWMFFCVENLLHDTQIVESSHFDVLLDKCVVNLALHESFNVCHKNIPNSPRKNLKKVRERIRKLSSLLFVVSTRSPLNYYLSLCSMYRWMCWSKSGVMRISQKHPKRINLFNK
jgi:hypothetical protein